MRSFEILDDAERRLAAAGVDGARLDAEVLLAHALGIARSDLYALKGEALPREAIARFEGHLSRRAEGCPVAYITGVKEFWSIPIKVTPAVLIPRPETELVVERALEIAGMRSELLILDICAGSGCIAAALAKELPRARFVVADISPAAMEVARENLEFARGRVEFRVGDLFDALGPECQPPLAAPFDLITANPPYIPIGQRRMLGREITDHEPSISLYGGSSGLDFMARIIEDASRFLKAGGWLIMEMGLGQSDKLVTMAERCGGYGEAVISKDLAGIERALSLKRHG